MKTKITKLLTALALSITLLLGMAPTRSEAVIIGTADYNDTITAIFGTGNPDGSWVSASASGTVAALRFRERFTTNMPNNGAGVFTFPLGTDVNFDFSLSTGTAPLANYAFTLGVDNDPAFGVESYIPFFFDPVVVYGDNSYGNSGTLNGAGVEGNVTLALVNSVAQNSQRMGGFPFNTNLNSPGEYKNILSIYTKGAQPRLIAQTEATLILGERPAHVPDNSGTFALGSLAFIGLIAFKRLTTRRPANVSYKV